MKNDLPYEEFAEKCGVHKADAWHACRACRAALKQTKGLESMRSLAAEELMHYEEFSEQHFKAPICRRQDHEYVNPPKNWWNRRRLFRAPRGDPLEDLELFAEEFCDDAPRSHWHDTVAQLPINSVTRWIHSLILANP